MQKKMTVTIMFCTVITIFIVIVIQLQHSEMTKRVNDEIAMESALTQEQRLLAKEVSALLKDSQEMREEATEMLKVVENIEQVLEKSTILVEENLALNKEILKSEQYATIEEKLANVTGLLKSCQGLLDVTKRTHALHLQVNSNSSTLNPKIQNAFNFTKRTLSIAIDEYATVNQLIYEIDTTFAKEIFEQQLDSIRQQVSDLDFADELDFDVYIACIDDVEKLSLKLKNFTTLLF